MLVLVAVDGREARAVLLEVPVEASVGEPCVCDAESAFWAVASRSFRCCMRAVFRPPRTPVENWRIEAVVFRSPSVFWFCVITGRPDAWALSASDWLDAETLSPVSLSGRSTLLVTVLGLDAWRGLLRRLPDVLIDAGLVLPAVVRLRDTGVLGCVSWVAPASASTCCMISARFVPVVFVW